jgi:hypothetical protein
MLWRRALCWVGRKINGALQHLGWGVTAFDRKARTLVASAGQTTASFVRLNESARPAAAKVRRLIDDLLVCYPRRKRGELITRIRSRDEDHVLHELLVRSGCRIDAIEPAVEGSTKVPDFLVTGPSGEEFYMEARVAMGVSDEDATAETRLREALDAIDEVTSPDYLIDVRYSGAPVRTARAARLRRVIQSWLDGLDYDSVRERWENDGVLPEFEVKEQGTRFFIEAVPRGSTRGETGPGVIGSYGMADVSTVRPSEPIRTAVRKKSSRYGDLPRPYLVAVNALSQFARDDSVVEALLGSERIVSAGGQSWIERNDDGVWTPGRNTRVSAVLCVERLSAWSLGQVRGRIILNPWARRPFVAFPPGLEKHWLENGAWQREEGRSVREILCLTENWPE